MERQKLEQPSSPAAVEIDTDEARPIGDVIAQIMDRFGGDAANAEAAVVYPLPVGCDPMDKRASTVASASQGSARFGEEGAGRIHAALLCGGN